MCQLDAAAVAGVIGLDEPPAEGMPEPAFGAVVGLRREKKHQFLAKKRTCFRVAW
jgi:hypothetical protein